MSSRTVELSDIQTWITEFINTDFHDLFPKVTEMYYELVDNPPMLKFTNHQQFIESLDCEGGELIEDLWNQIVAMGIIGRPTVSYEGDGVYILDAPAPKPKGFVAIDLPKKYDVPFEIRCVVACSNAEGTPDFYPTTVETELMSYESGDHYDEAKCMATDNGYDGPFIVYDEMDGPDWLFEKLF
jgi:hypothetical protein